MKYERFSEIWDKYMPEGMTFEAEPNTIVALIEYSQGNKQKMEEVRRILEQ